MSNFMKAIYNPEIGDLVAVEMTDEEKAQHLKDIEEATEKQKKAAAKAATRLELLNRLGITEEEAKLLLS